MKKSGVGKLIKFAFCICITVLGVFMTFFYRDSDRDDKENISENSVIEIQVEDVEEKSVFGHAENTLKLPDTENVSEAESYTSGMNMELYFSNTSVIDQGNLPLEVHAVLVNSAQKYLHRSGYEDVSELYIDEESYIEDNNKIAFNCYMDGYSEQLRIIYEIAESKLKFSIVD